MMKKAMLTRTLALMLAVSMAGCGVKVTKETTTVDETTDNAQSTATVAADDEINHATEAESASASSEASTIADEDVNDGVDAAVDEATDVADSEAAADDTEDITDESVADVTEGTADTEEITPDAEETTDTSTNETAAATITENAAVSENDAEKLNSFSMMYYLAITAEEIRTSKDNRLVLEDIYTSLLNDINPGAIDEITQDHLKNLRDIIKAYLNVSTKRERLQFIYNQQKASAIRSAVPNPLSVLSVSNAMDWKKLALSVAYTAVDSYNNYKKAEESADMAYIMSGWELDDEEKDTIMKNRDRAFDYMVDMVQAYHLDGLKTLNEESIEKFAEISATENPTERIRLLKAEEDQYSLLGNYWLELADAYFETEHYSKCLDCVEKYDELATGIYRKDYNYLQILPKAIVAAQETYYGRRYITTVEKYADAIIANTSSDDWSSRYFAAQVYMDLYSRTSDDSYLDKAYEIASENVTVLLKEQRSLNTTYTNKVEEQTAEEPDYRYMSDAEKKEAQKEYKAEQKRVKEYNKALNEARKTELPSLYEPLVLNCELLFALADQRHMTKADKNEIEALLKTETNGIFTVRPINDAYSFSNRGNTYSIEFNKEEMIIPVTLLTEESVITVSVDENGKTTEFNDCVVTKVDRKGKTIDTFDAYVSSKSLKKYAWTPDSEITITIKYADAYDKTIDFAYGVGTFEEHWYGDKVEFVAQ